MAENLLTPEKEKGKDEEYEDLVSPSFCSPAQKRRGLISSPTPTSENAQNNGEEVLYLS